jgi:integrase
VARPTAEYETKSKTARLRLAVRPKAYYRGVGGGKSLGYIRRDSGPGSWLVREWIGGRYSHRIIGSADDLGHADGRDVLTFEQALRLATAPALPLAARFRISVKDALDHYFVALAARSAHATGAKQTANKHIVPALGGYRVDRLTKTQIEQWRDSLVKDDDPEDPDARRRSQDTANRILTVLKAALNLAFSDDANSIPTDAAWRRVKPFKDSGRARQDHFTAAEVRKLIAKAATFDKPFANLCEAAFVTGARLGELVALNVADFDASRAVLNIRKGKTGSRSVTLSDEAVSFFKRLTDKRPAAAVLLPGADGAQWDNGVQHRRFKEAAKLAELPASASFYSLRHSYISRVIESGMPLTLIAENCGTSLVMIQKSYAHILAQTRRDLVNEHAPRLRRVK